MWAMKLRTAGIALLLAVGAAETIDSAGTCAEDPAAETATMAAARSPDRGDGLMQVGKQHKASVVLDGSGGAAAVRDAAVGAAKLSIGSLPVRPKVPPVSVKFSLRDSNAGVELLAFGQTTTPAPVSLAQESRPEDFHLRFNPSSITALNSTELHLAFDARGLHFEYDLQKMPSLFTKNATIVVTAENGTEEVLPAPTEGYYLSANHDAVLSLVGNGVQGLVRQGDTFYDVEAGEGASLLTVHGGVEMEGYTASLRQQPDPNNPPERWTNCYTYDYATRALAMGVVVGSKMYSGSDFGSVSRTEEWLQNQFAITNLIYQPQLNFVLEIDYLRIETYYAGQTWDQGSNCPLTINTQLERFERWQKPKDLGLWHIFDDCYSSGAIGLAYLGVLCGAFDAGLSWYSGYGTWRTFAHEVGHNFGGDHSFEQGQGTTGGIMDYGDGTYQGKYQFNTQFRKNEMCEVMNRAVNDQSCSAITYWSPSPTPTPAPTRSPTRAPTPPPSSNPTPSPQWETISSSRACESNNEGIERIDVAFGTLQQCFAACQSKAGCVAVDYYRDSTWCNLYDRACSNPSATHGGASSYKLRTQPTPTRTPTPAPTPPPTPTPTRAPTPPPTRAPTPTPTRAPTPPTPSPQWETISSSRACESNDEGIERIDVAFGTLQQCFAACQSKAGCVAVDYYRDSTWCNLYDRACSNPGSTHGGASSYKIRSASPTRPPTPAPTSRPTPAPTRPPTPPTPSPQWETISSSRACESNNEGIERIDVAFGTLQQCFEACENKAGCVAVDYYRDSTWCNLYDRACSSPSSSHGGASSYRRRGWSLAPQSSNDCPAGYSPVLSRQDCESLAPSACSAGYQFAGSWSSDPSGCFIYGPGGSTAFADCSVYFNELRSTNPTSAGRWKICSQ